MGAKLRSGGELTIIRLPSHNCLIRHRLRLGPIPITIKANQPLAAIGHMRHLIRPIKVLIRRHQRMRGLLFHPFPLAALAAGVAHEAGFGGGLLSTGLLIAICAWHAPSTRAFRQAIVLSGLAGFGCAIGVHFVEGYTDFTHLAPAIVGALIFAVAITLEFLGARAPQTDARS